MKIRNQKAEIRNRKPRARSFAALRMTAFVSAFCFLISNFAFGQVTPQGPGGFTASALDTLDTNTRNLLYGVWTAGLLGKNCDYPAQCLPQLDTDLKNAVSGIQKLDNTGAASGSGSIVVLMGGPFSNPTYLANGSTSSGATSCEGSTTANAPSPYYTNQASTPGNCYVSSYSLIQRLIGANTFKAGTVFLDWGVAGDGDEAWVNTSGGQYAGTWAVVLNTILPSVNNVAGCCGPKQIEWSWEEVVNAKSTCCSGWHNPLWACTASNCDAYDLEVNIAGTTRAMFGEAETSATASSLHLTIKSCRQYAGWNIQPHSTSNNDASSYEYDNCVALRDVIRAQAAEMATAVAVSSVRRNTGAAPCNSANIECITTSSPHGFSTGNVISIVGITSDTTLNTPCPTSGLTKNVASCLGASITVDNASNFHFTNTGAASGPYTSQGQATQLNTFTADDGHVVTIGSLAYIRSTLTGTQITGVAPPITIGPYLWAPPPPNARTSDGWYSPCTHYDSGGQHESAPDAAAQYAATACTSYGGGEKYCLYCSGAAGDNGGRADHAAFLDKCMRGQLSASLQLHICGNVDAYTKNLLW